MKETFLSSASADSDLVLLPSGATMTVAEHREMVKEIDWRDRVYEGVE